MSQYRLTSPRAPRERGAAECRVEGLPVPRVVAEMALQTPLHQRDGVGAWPPAAGLGGFRLDSSRPSWKAKVLAVVRPRLPLGVASATGPEVDVPPSQPRLVAPRGLWAKSPSCHLTTQRRRLRGPSPCPARDNGHARDTHSWLHIAGGGRHQLMIWSPSPGTWTYFYGRQYLKRVFICRVLKEVRGYFQCHLITLEAEKPCSDARSSELPFAEAFPQHEQRASPLPPGCGRVASSQTGLSQPTVAYSSVSGNTARHSKVARHRIESGSQRGERSQAECGKRPDVPVSQISAGTQGGTASGRQAPS